MAEALIGFLYKASTIFLNTETNKSHKILRSHYLMRCKEITRGYGLPKKHFSEKTRCASCCLEWNNKAVTKLKAVKLSKQQRRRIKTKYKKQNNESLLHSKEVEKICSFCGKSINIPVGKFDKPPIKFVEEKAEAPKEQNITKIKQMQHTTSQKASLSVYYTSKDAFSLNKNKNTLSTTIKEQPKLIKNSKKKKDKFAGLCQKAVIAATKLKEEKTKENKLHLFLKPST